MLKKDWPILKKISVGFFISLGIEVLQFVLSIGATDITDLIGNTFGGIVGILVFYLFSKVTLTGLSGKLSLFAMTTANPDLLFLNEICSDTVNDVIS